jgi:hypothetical protein
MKMPHGIFFIFHAVYFYRLFAQFYFMKKLLLSALSFFLLMPVLFAGALKSDVLSKDATGHWQYEKVIEVPNSTKEVLYKKMKDWVISNIKSVDVNSSYDDKNFEEIVTTPTLAIEDTKNKLVRNQSINFKFRILFKDNKMKIEATNFNYFGIDMNSTIHTDPLENVVFKRIIPDPAPRVQEKLDAVLNAFITAAETAAKSEKKSNDW